MGNGDHMTDKKELAKFVKDLINQNQELIVEKHELGLGLKNCQLGIEGLKAKISDQDKLIEKHRKIAREIHSFKMEMNLPDKFGMVTWEDITCLFNTYTTAIRGMIKQIGIEPSKDECKLISLGQNKDAWKRDALKLKYDLEKVRRRLQKSNEKLQDHTLCQIRYGPPYNKISELENEIKEWVDSDAKLLKVIYSKNKYIEELKQERKELESENQDLGQELEETKQELKILDKNNRYLQKERNELETKLKIISGKVTGIRIHGMHLREGIIASEIREILDRTTNEYLYGVIPNNWPDAKPPIPVKEGADIPPFKIPCPVCNVDMNNLVKGSDENHTHWNCPKCKGDFWQR